MGLGFGVERAHMERSLRARALMGWVSPRERAALGAAEIAASDRVLWSWYSEGIQALCWALGLVDLQPERPFDDDLDQVCAHGRDPASFLERASLRPIEEVQAEVDLHYRLHWWCRNAAHCPLQGGLVRARRHALEWVYNGELGWDEVTLDT